MPTYKPVNDSFRDLLLRNSHYRARLENGTIRKMVAPYLRTRDDIIARLTSAEKWTGYTKDFRIMRLNAQLAEIEGVLNAAAMDSAGVLREELQSLALLEKDAQYQMLANKFNPVGIDIVQLPYKHIDWIMENPLIYQYRGITIDNALWEANGKAVDIMRRELTQSIIQGEDMAQASRRLMKPVAKFGGLAAEEVKKRVKVIARSEIQHVSNQVSRGIYFENQDVLKGVRFCATLDNRTCMRCMSLSDRLYKFRMGEDHSGPVLPLHPMCRCFIDYQIPIYTSKGIERIGDIKVGDLVLTHSGKFKKVIHLVRHKQKRPDVVTIEVIYPKLSNVGNSPQKRKLTMTFEHPLLVNGDWREAQNVKVGDRVNYLAVECKRCGKLIPFDKKYCSDSCHSKDTTEGQWADPKHRKNVSEKNRIANLEQYASGKRDGKANTKKAHEKMRLLGKQGLHPSQFGCEWMKGENSPSKRPDVRKKISLSKMGDKNPMRKYPELAVTAGKRMKQFFIDNPDKHPNRIMAKKGHETGIEKKFRKALESRNVKFEKQYPILSYFVDFALPELKIAIEVDGEYWHQDKGRDRKRQDEIEAEGWLVLRYKGREVADNVENCVDELSRVMMNHSGNYEFMDLEVIGVRHWKTEQKSGRCKLDSDQVKEIRKLAERKVSRQELAKRFGVSVIAIRSIIIGESWKDGTNVRNVNLYNISVEGDESYIAKGFVTHNCTYIPETYSWKELGDKTTKEVSPGKRASFGVPTKALTYDAWLKTLSEAEQIELLGPGRHKLWKEGRVKLSQMATDKKIYSVKKLEEMYLKEPKLFPPKFEPANADLISSYARLATKSELTKLSNDYSKIPVEIRKWGEASEKTIKVAVIPEGKGILARAEGRYVYLNEDGLKLGKYSGINQHELRHVLVSDEVMRANAGGNKMWKELNDLNIGIPIHTNVSYIRNGRNSIAGVDEFLTMVGDNYKSGMTVAEQVVEVRRFIDVEIVKGSRQISYGEGISKWNKNEAEQAVVLWRRWMNIE